MAFRSAQVLAFQELEADHLNPTEFVGRVDQPPRAPRPALANRTRVWGDPPPRTNWTRSSPHARALAGRCTHRAPTLVGAREPAAAPRRAPRSQRRSGRPACARVEWLCV